MESGHLLTSVGQLNDTPKDLQKKKSPSSDAFKAGVQ